MNFLESSSTTLFLIISVQHCRGDFKLRFYIDNYRRRLQYYELFFAISFESTTTSTVGPIKTIFIEVKFLHSSYNATGHFNGWNYPLELQHLVHHHWRSFPETKIYYHAFFFIMIFILMLSSIFGNGLVLWIFGSSKNLRTPSNLLIINLAIFDLTMCCNMPHFLMNTVMGYFVGGDLGCNIYAMLGGISGIGAATTNACIAYDRYKTISNPIDGRLSYGQIAILISLTWLWTVPFSVLPFCKIWGRYLPEGFLTSASFDYVTDTEEIRFFILSMFTWVYVLPMMIICTYYTKLFLHVRNHERMLADQAKKMNIKSLSANVNAAAMSVEMRIAKAAMTIFLLFFCAWTPYSIVALMGYFRSQHLVTPFASMLPAACAKSVSCIDPWVYAASHPKYRSELERRLPWLGIRERGGASSNGVSNGNDGETSTMQVD